MYRHIQVVLASDSKIEVLRFQAFLVSFPMAKNGAYWGFCLAWQKSHIGIQIGALLCLPMERQEMQQFVVPQIVAICGPTDCCKQQQAKSSSKFAHFSLRVAGCPFQGF